MTRAIRCRYLDRRDNRCESEALDPDAELVLCVRHTAAAVALSKYLADVATYKLTPKETS